MGSLRNTLVTLCAMLCLLPAAVAFAQDATPTTPTTATMDRSINVRPKPTGVTPRTPDGHPDLTGLWNGAGGDLGSLPNQMHNDGIAIESQTSSHDVYSGARIATWPVTDRKPIDDTEGERAATLLRRVGSNKPIYRPKYWEMVKELDANANEEDPSNNCMPAGIPRGGPPTYIGQFPSYFIFIYPGEGGLIATQTMYRMIPADGRKHTPLADLDGTYTGEGIAHWEGDTLVVDTWGFNTSTWFDQLGGDFHSENMHVVERFHRDGNELTWTATVDDPDVLLQPWTTTPRIELLNPNPKAILQEVLPCSERELAHAVTKDHH